MNLITNIVLESNNGRTSSYMVQLINSDQNESFKFQSDGDLFVLLNENYDSWVRRENEWYEEEIVGTSYQLKKSTIRVYFPQYLIDTYTPKSKYMLSLHTYIHGKVLEIGNFLFERKDALAIAPVRFDGMDQYFEYIDFEIPNPIDIHYSDDTTDIRTAMGEPEGQNNTGAQLSVCLAVVEEGEGCLIKKNDVSTGQNSIQLDENTDMQLHLSFDIDEDRVVKLGLSFNNYYEGDIHGYLEETYNRDTTRVVWEYVIMNDEDIFFQDSKTALINGEDDSSYCEFENEFFTSWDQWSDGLYLVGTVSFYTISDDEDQTPFITLFSNKLPISQDLFAKMLPLDGVPSKINLDSLGMNEIKISAYNKIDQQVVNNAPVKNNDKSNLVHPVFYQTRNLKEVVIHPAVTENVSLDLNTYKPYVDMFLVQIEGVSFKEIGRTGSKCIFAIYGNMLPKKENSGTLYILDQDGQLVTTGKYIYSY